MKTENIYKLATKEDPYHIHKTLGIITLTNFLSRYTCLFLYGSFFLDNAFAMYLLGIHALLSLTSIQFHIPNRRNPSQPMIYPEFRMHSILFAMRSVACCYMGAYDYNVVYRITTCFATMALADLTTYWYKDHKAHSTMRGMPFDPSITPKQQKDIIHMQSAMQVGATLYVLGNTTTAFAPLLPIQLAAFLMTLVRKNIINTNMWHLVYNMSLWINVVCYFYVPTRWMTLQIVLFYSFLKMRFKWNWNKYFCWSVVFFLFYMHETYDILTPFDYWIEQNKYEQWYRTIVVAIYCTNQLPRFWILLKPLLPNVFNVLNHFTWVMVERFHEEFRIGDNMINEDNDLPWAQSIDPLKNQILSKKC